MDKVLVVYNKQTGKVCCTSKSITRITDLNYFMKVYDQDIFELRELETKPFDLQNALCEPTVGDVGYIGVGKYNPDCSGDRQCYYVWKGILRRCYSDEDGRDQCYKNGKVTVCGEWYNFQNFAEWYYENKIKHCDIDKDLLADGDCKIYSPETCCFLPRAINSSLIRVSSCGNVYYREGKKRAWKIRFKILGEERERTFLTEDEARERLPELMQELFSRRIRDYKYTEQFPERVLHALDNYFLKYAGEYYQE